MTTDRDKCSLSSFLPISCRGRAEAFARRLQSRMKSLGSHRGNGVDENSWLSAHADSVTLTQPRQLSADPDLLFDVGMMESPGSPEKEMNAIDFNGIVNKQPITQYIREHEDCQCSSCEFHDAESNPRSENYTTPSLCDSDSSDGTFFDTADTEADLPPPSPLTKSASASEEFKRNGDSDFQNKPDKLRSYSQDSCISTVFTTPPSTSSSASTLTDDVSTLSLRDEDCASESETGQLERLRPHIEITEKGIISNAKSVARCEVDDVCDESKPKISNTANKESQEKEDQLEGDIIREKGCEEREDTQIKRETYETADKESKCDTNSNINRETYVELKNEIKNEKKSIAEMETRTQVTSERNEEITTATEFQTNLKSMSEVIERTIKTDEEMNSETNSQKNLKEELLELREQNNLKPERKDSASAIVSDNQNLPQSPTENLSFDNLEDDEDEEAEKQSPRVRRCSSLKTGKTPPETPARKKIVRFADALGLEIADVRTYLDDIPNVPSYAFDDLGDAVEKSLSGSGIGGVRKVLVNKILVILFQQPGGQPNFIDRVREKYVILENAFVEDPISFSIAGSVRVRNLDFHKSVYIRYTMDSWKTYTDVQAIYVENSCDGFSDKFKFLIYANSLSIGKRLELAVRFHCKGSQYWDNNNGVNYCFQCLPGSQPTYNSTLSFADDDDYRASFY